MDKRNAHYQEQDDPIQGETDCDAKERETAANIHRISRPCEHAASRERQCWLRRSSVCADALAQNKMIDFNVKEGERIWGSPCLKVLHYIPGCPSVIR
jgi:hypothetical protein